MLELLYGGMLCATLLALALRTPALTLIALVANAVVGVIEAGQFSPAEGGDKGLVAVIFIVLLLLLFGWPNREKRRASPDDDSGSSTSEAHASASTNVDFRDEDEPSFRSARFGGTPKKATSFPTFGLPELPSMDAFGSLYPPAPAFGSLPTYELPALEPFVFSTQFEAPALPNGWPSEFPSLPDSTGEFAEGWEPPALDFGPPTFEIEAEILPASPLEEGLPS